MKLKMGGVTLLPPPPPPQMPSWRAQGQLYHAPMISQYIIHFMEPQGSMKYGYPLPVD